MARRKKIEMPKPELNITSMMDLVLNLLTFFVLVSNFAAAELPPLEPPNPEHSKAIPKEVPNAITLNIIPFYGEHGLAAGDGQAAGIKFGASEQFPPGESSQLKEALAKEVRKSADVTINIRADRTLRYDQISPVMKVIKESGVKNINVVAQLTD